MTAAPINSGSFRAKIGKPETRNPGPGQVLPGKYKFVPSRTQENDVTV